MAYIFEGSHREPSSEFPQPPISHGGVIFLKYVHTSPDEVEADLGPRTDLPRLICCSRNDSRSRAGTKALVLLPSC
jgi:hypothetical protein